MINIIKKKIYDVIVALFGDTLALCDVEVAVCGDERFGHYQSNCALKLTRYKKLAPLTIAKEIGTSLKKEHIFAKVTISKPGFINFTLDTIQLAQHLTVLGRSRYLGVKPLKEPKKVLIDFSSPNIAKELHVGHLRSTILGDCMARLFEFLNHDVLRINHVGDWGTPFGILIAFIKIYHPDIEKVQARITISTLMDWYKRSYEKYKTDEQFHKTAKKEVVALQNSDANSLKIWNILCDISRKSYNRIYRLLNIKITERGESFYRPYIPQVMKDLVKKDLVTTSDGAKCVFIDDIKGKNGNPMPFMLQKKDGGYTYDTTDLVALKYRVAVDKAEKIIILTDVGQSLHFKLLFAVAKKAGFYGGSSIKHIGFGLVTAPSGKKFKTREGKTERLIDLIKEGVTRFEKLVASKNRKISQDEVKSIARVLAINAIKYADLSTLRHKNYKFDYDKMLRYEGNTSNFLMYAYVRIYGIYKELQVDPKTLLDTKIILKHRSEIRLAFHLQRFPEIIEIFKRDLFPNVLCDYLYELAQRFNVFFRDCRIKGSSASASRLALSEICRRIMEKAFRILGLKTLTKM